LSTNPFRVLRHRDYALFWFAAVVSDIGTWMQAVTVGIIVADQTGKASSTGLIAAAAFAPQAFAAPIGGVIADRFDRRNVLRISLTVQTAITLALSILLARGNPSTAAMALLVLMQGTTNSIGQPAAQAMLPDLVPREELISAVALGIVSWNSGRIIGPALAGIIIELTSAARVIQLNAFSFVVLLGAVSLLRRPFRAPEGTVHLPFASSLRVGFDTIRGTPTIRQAAQVAALSQLCFIALAGLVPIVAKNVHHGASGLTSVMTTGQGIGSLIGATMIPTVVAYIGRSRSVAITAATTAVAITAVLNSPWRAGAVAAMVVYGMVLMGTQVAMMGAVQRDAPPESRARVLSMFQAGFGLFYGIPVLAIGWAGDRFGLRISFGVLTAIGVLWLTDMIVRRRAGWRLINSSDPPPLMDLPRRGWL
jgi:MFS family permease